MQKWEYTWVLADAADWEVYVSGEVYKLGDYLDKLGENGWEMVGFQTGSPGANYVFFFKRPIGSR